MGLSDKCETLHSLTCLPPLTVWPLRLLSPLTCRPMYLMGNGGVTRGVTENRNVTDDFMVGY